MKPGEYILGAAGDVPKDGQIILFLRHSKRASFQGVPDHLRHAAEITPEGVLLAREFGAALGRFFPGRDLVLAHTPAVRCRMTAEYIGDGFSPEGHFRINGGAPEVIDPVLDPHRFIELREEIGWHRLMQKWLMDEISGSILAPAGEYSRSQMRNLLSFTGAEKDILVVVGHDITLFPLVYHVMGRPLTTIGFLNGIVISVNGDRASVRFADDEGLIRKELDKW